MDDFLILSYNKEKLHQIKKELKEFLANELMLKLHSKKANVFPAEKGIDFLGYQIFSLRPYGARGPEGNYKLLRKSTVKRFIKRTKVYRRKLKENSMTEEKFNQSLQSWLAYAKFGNSYQLRKNLSEKLKVKLIE